MYGMTERVHGSLKKEVHGCGHGGSHPCFSTPAILLKRTELGDFDLLITFLTLTNGKITSVGKNAKKSRKRFSGLLEPFTALHLVCRKPFRGGIPVLQEAAMENPFSGIRGNVGKTAYASYWCELVNGWLEEGKAQEKIFYLLYYCLNMLSCGRISERVLSVVFQVRFLTLAGFAPEFGSCVMCRRLLDDISGTLVYLDMPAGGILCGRCREKTGRPGIALAMGTVKQLIWIQENGIDTAIRIKFTARSLKEGLFAMESFVPYHLGREPKSLGFLRKLREMEREK